jgi:hypothetical protein
MKLYSYILYKRNTLDLLAEYKTGFPIPDRIYGGYVGKLHQLSVVMLRMLRQLCRNTRRDRIRNYTLEGELK